MEQNLTLGLETTTAGFIRKNRRAEKAYDVLKDIDSTISLNHRVSDLSVAQKQIIEITKAISSAADIIVMDEATAALTEEETERLFSIIDKLKKQNVTVIYISHRLAEIFRIGDYVTVLRDGKMVGTKPLSDLLRSNDEQNSYAELIKMMLGKVVVEHYVPSSIDYQSKVLELKSVTTSKLKNVSIEMYKGEIIGCYGLIGSGKTEIARAIFGLDRLMSGSIELNGKAVNVRQPRAAIMKGLSMVPEERRTEGLFTGLSLKENIPVMNMKPISSYGLFSRRKEKMLANKFVDKLRIVARDVDQTVSLLSGGNQQKVVISKCLNAECMIFLLDEPTRGVDVGAKEEIHNIIRKLSKQGASIMVFSSELPEILNLCDRIILMYNGRIKATLKNNEEIDSERIMHIVARGEEA